MTTTTATTTTSPVAQPLEVMLECGATCGPLQPLQTTSIELPNNAAYQVNTPSNVIDTGMSHCEQGQKSCITMGTATTHM
eukprot:6787718-Pyramimonas_sp.AAC.1